MSGGDVVTVLANETTGLAQPDVFYFGNAIGESGNSTTDAKVNAFDMLGNRTTPVGEVRFENVRVPADAILAVDTVFTQCIGESIGGVF